MAVSPQGHRPRREHRLPARYRDTLPEPVPVVVTNEDTSSDLNRPTRLLPRIRLIVQYWKRGDYCCKPRPRIVHPTTLSLVNFALETI